MMMMTFENIIKDQLLLLTLVHNFEKTLPEH